MNERTAILDIQGLNKSFGPKHVLRDLSMTLERGRVYGLLGKNGAGKTTLIRIVMGIIPADGGRLFFENSLLSLKQAAYRNRIGYIPEDSFFYQDMTVGGLLDLNASFYHSWNRDRALELCRTFELGQKARIKALSRGMKLKLGFAAALAQEPELLILDDPTSGLDVPTRREILMGLIREIADSGTTVLFASHLVHELDGLIEHVCLLHNGKITVDESFSLLKESMRRVTLTFDSPPESPPFFKGQIGLTICGREMEVVFNDWEESRKQELLVLQPRHMDIQPLSLEDMFTAWVAGDKGRGE